MALPLTDLGDALRAAGLTVRELPGWKTRGQTDGPFTPRGVMWHHDASAPGDSPGVPQYMANLANNGAQLWVDRYGVWHLVAAGRMWHAGSGGGWGRIPAGAGNTYSVGIETDHTTGEAWPTVQVSSLRRGTAVLLLLLGANAGDALCGHKEYRTTNPDPDGLSMADERRAVADLMTNPQQEDDMANFTEEQRDVVVAAARKILAEYDPTADDRPLPIATPDDITGHVLSIRGLQQKMREAEAIDRVSIAAIETVVNQILQALTQLQVSGQTQEGFDALFRTSPLAKGLLREGAVFVDNDPPNPPSGG